MRHQSSLAKGSLLFVMWAHWLFSWHKRRCTRVTLLVRFAHPFPETLETLHTGVTGARCSAYRYLAPSPGPSFSPMGLLLSSACNVRGPWFQDVLPACHVEPLSVLRPSAQLGGHTRFLSLCLSSVSRSSMVEKLCICQQQGARIHSSSDCTDSDGNIRASTSE